MSLVDEEQRRAVCFDEAMAGTFMYIIDLSLALEAAYIFTPVFNKACPFLPMTRPGLQGKEGR